MGVEYKHVFMDRISPVVLGDNVILENTGLVHTAPSYGVDDYNLGKEYNLEMVFGIEDNGVLNDESGIFSGLYFEDANKKVIKHLNETGYLLKETTITHSYPHDWRTKKPIIYRATSQWFCSIETIKDEILSFIDKDIKVVSEWEKLDFII